MLGNPCVSIEAVNYVEILYILRGLGGKVICASSAEDKNVDLVLVSCCIVYGINGNALCHYLYRSGITACKNCLEAHIFVLTDRELNASSKVAVA